jgi:hypothetical protein
MSKWDNQFEERSTGSGHETCHKRIAELEAELQALREAAQLVVDKALTHSYLEGPVEQAIDALQAALLKEGGDEGTL